MLNWAENNFEVTKHCHTSSSLSFHDYRSTANKRKGKHMPPSILYKQSWYEMTNGKIIWWSNEKEWNKGAGFCE